MEKTLLITGNTGTGKTHLAVATLRHFTESGTTKALFEPCSIMMSRFKATYNGIGSEIDLIKEYSAVQVLVIDDLGTENITENSISLLTTIIDQRMGQKYSRTILTSNFKPAKLEQIYGSRLLSRLTGHTGRHIHVTAEDYRKRGKES
jgi:DNA replication protein DnaC